MEETLMSPIRMSKIESGVRVVLGFIEGRPDLRKVVLRKG